MRSPSMVLAFLSGLLWPASATAQQKVDVQVTAASGESIYLDRGRDAGIAAGDRVALYSADHGILTATVQAVSRSSARCTLDVGALAIRVGTRGEVALAPRSEPPTPPPAQDESMPPAPKHEWSAPPEEWSRDQPLLSPAFARRPEDRPTQILGRMYFLSTYTADRRGSGNRYAQARLGSEMTVVNPVPWGGRLHVRTDALYEEASLADADDARETSVRLERLSYTYGGLQDQRLRVEAGRFLQHEFPELGVLDGLEIAPRLGTSLRIGASLGIVPEADRAVELGETAQVSIFARCSPSGTEDFTLGAALQKTWHEGERDRDLILAVAEYAPSPKLFARASLWVDYYTDSEQVERSGFELTEAHLNVTYRFDPQHGVGGYLVRLQRADLRRDELDPTLAKELEEDGTLRFGLFTWQRLSTHVLLDGRASRWIDEDAGEDGTLGEVRLALQNLIVGKGEVAFTLYHADGVFASGPGARLTATQFAAPVSITLWYDVAWYELAPSAEESVQQSVHLSFDAALSTTWSAFLAADYRFGDDQDSRTLSVSVQKRF